MARFVGIQVGVRVAQLVAYGAYCALGGRRARRLLSRKGR